MIERFVHSSGSSWTSYILNICHRYKDQQALKTHGTSEKFAAFQKQLEKEDLMRAPMLLKMVSEQAGFSSRL